VIENEGVQPDIVVDIDPAGMQRGYDAQLMKAVDYLMRKLRTEPLQDASAAAGADDALKSGTATVSR